MTMTTNKKEHCHANRDGDCRHKSCPQNKDKEPATSGRSCPLSDYEDEADIEMFGPEPAQFGLLGIGNK